MKKEIFVFLLFGIMISGCGFEKRISTEVEQINDSLTICVMDTDQPLFLDKPLSEFRKRYPEVNVEIQTVAFQDLENQQKEMAANLMAGDGADFYLNPDNVLEDVYKAQEAGAFEDLMPWFRQMEDFSEEDYLDGTFDLYEHTDACYVFPSTVYATKLAVRKDIQESLGIDVNSWANATDLLDAIEKFYEVYPTEQPFLDVEACTNFLSGYGYNISDGMKNAEILDMPAFRKDMELYKKQAYRNGVYVVEQSDARYEEEKEKLYRGETIHLGKQIFSGIDDYILMGGEEKADLAYFYGADGTMLVGSGHNYAIAAGSANKENAFHLLEIILELEAENSEILAPSTNKEVNKEYIRQQKEKWMKDEVVIDGQVYPGLTEKTFQKLENLYTNGTVDLLQMYPGFKDCMEPYFKGESEMEPCIEKFRDYLEIYYSE